MMARVLIAGIGNIMLSDDGFGTEVARRLATRDLPEGVTAADYGIRGMHLAYDLMDGDYDTTIMVDAVSRGGEAGELYVIEADTDSCAEADVDAHGMTPVAVIGLLHRFSETPGRVLVLGCEPACLDEDIGLSEPVAAAVDTAVEQVLELAVSEARGTPAMAAREE